MEAIASDSQGSPEAEWTPENQAPAVRSGLASSKKCKHVLYNVLRSGGAQQINDTPRWIVGMPMHTIQPK